MEKGANREIYLNYFIDKLFCRIQCNPCEKSVSYEQVRERAELATDIYFRLQAKEENASKSLSEAFEVLYNDCNFHNSQ